MQHPSEQSRSSIHAGPGQAPLAWVRQVRNGLSVDEVSGIAGYLSLPLSEVATRLAIPARTLARRKREGVLSVEESEKVLRALRVIARANAVFGDGEKAALWIKSENPALEGETPFALLDTDVGGEAVMDALGRIEHGLIA